jgi:hypothetical protein
MKNVAQSLLDLKMAEQLFFCGRRTEAAMDTGDVEHLIKQIALTANAGNELVSIIYIPAQFELLGVGTDAVVVRHTLYPAYAWKVFADERIAKKTAEYEVYQRLQESSFFATCFAQGGNYLCLSYEAGPTLYQCLEEGIVIPPQVIDDVAAACHFARERGLNPRDIHLKNVILQHGRAKLLDVSEYMKPGNDRRWEYLVTGYQHFYSLISGKKVPTWLIERVKNAYYQQYDEQFSVMAFCQRMLQLLGFYKKS